MNLSRLKFAASSLGERLWVKPLIHAFGVLAVILGASLLDLMVDTLDFLPDIGADLLIKLVTIIATTMLGVATFAVASMVSAYATASSTATPRAFKALVADNESQTALSVFIAAYIFAIMALITVEIGFLDKLGRFILFVAVLLYFAWVILTFVSWVDSIARLGRMGNTIGRVESETLEALRTWGPTRRLGAAAGHAPADAVAVYVKEADPGTDTRGEGIGHVMHLDLERLNDCAKENGAQVYLEASVGDFVTPAKPIARLVADGSAVEKMADAIRSAVVLGPQRSFDMDPRFGFVTLSEIARRALSPGINDSGSAIDVLKSLTRLFLLWDRIIDDPGKIRYSNVHLAPLDEARMFDDAFPSIARDGAGLVEVGLALQACFGALADADSPQIRDAALDHSRQAQARARDALSFTRDIERIDQAASKARNEVHAARSTSD